jgi:hypothetical protein
MQGYNIMYAVLSYNTADSALLRNTMGMRAGSMRLLTLRLLTHDLTNAVSCADTFATQ